MFKCRICGREFRRMENLSFHINKAKDHFSCEEYFNLYGNDYPNARREKHCVICGKDTKYVNFIMGYRKYCCKTCINHDPDVMKLMNQRRIESCKKKYGVEHYYQSEEFKDKAKKTWIKNLGYENPSQSKEIKQKKIETCKEHWGTDYPGQNEEIKKRIWNTFFTRFGKHAFITPKFSLESQRLFESIEQHLPKNTKCYFATNGDIETKTNEHQVIIKENEQYVRARFLDFYIPKFKKCIEFDEEFHKNQINEDIKRENEIKSMLPDIEIFRVSIEEYNNNFEQTLNKCLDFLDIRG